jgi:hypothetical protein
VIATSPATTPEAAPSEVARPSRTRSTSSQPSIAAAAAAVVFTQTRPVSPAKLVANWTELLANPSAPPATPGVAAGTKEPTLKPYQPNHSSPAPSIVNGRLCGRITSRPKPVRFPISSTRTRAATPALMCTTVPPA